MTVPPTLEENIGCLTKALNAHYTLVAPIKGESDKQAVMESVKAQIAKNNPNANAPDEQMLGLLATSQTCDIVQLLPCTQLSNFVGVNLYVDDKGQGKGSPQNMRASHICAACGLPQAVRDAFLAKMFDDQDGFERHDIRVSDIGSDASWVKEAAINANRSDPSAAAQLGMQGSRRRRRRRVSRSLTLSRRHLASSKHGDITGAAAKYSEASDLLRGAGSNAGSSGVVEMDERG